VRSTRGFTLIEVLLGLVVLGLAATATAVTMQSSANFVGENAMHVESMALAQEAMEGLRAMPFEDLVSGNRTSDDGRYGVAWVVEADTPEQGMKTVRLSTNWTWKGEPRAYVLTTVYSKISRR
jgi:prepilin-type N-terminal cleavage/methylation domain-containing protein